MSSQMNSLVIICISFLLLIGTLQAKKTQSWRSFWIELVAIAIFSFFLNALFGFPFPSGTTAKGPNEDLIFSFVLYICMLAGMLSHYLYRHLARPQNRRLKWDWGLFLAPVFASPIVFIPLLAAFQGAGSDFRQMTAQRFMIFFVAFQNGFFWKEFFDHKRKSESINP